MARNRYQQGSVFKRGKRNQQWVGRYREDILGPDMTVHRVRRTVQLGTVAEIGGKKEASRRLAEYIRPLNSSQAKPKRLITLQDFVESSWMPGILPTLKTSTQKQYCFLLKRFLLPQFGTKLMDNLQREEVQSFMSALLARVAPKTVRATAAVLSSVYRTAIDWEYALVNPVKGVHLPPNRPKSEKRTLSPREFQDLYSEMREPARTIALTAVLTGMRIGEVLALQWNDLDFDRATILVRRSVYEGKFSEPKTVSSRRTLAMGSALQEVLMAWRTRGESSCGLVFPSMHGGALNSSNLLRRLLRPAAEKMGLTGVGWHTLRHTHTTWLKDAGVQPNVAQLQLGHADIQTTLGIYTHVHASELRTASEAVERILAPNGPKSLGDNIPAEPVTT